MEASSTWETLRAVLEFWIFDRWYIYHNICVTLHWITFDYITLPYITLHYIALRYIT